MRRILLIILPAVQHVEPETRASCSFAAQTVFVLLAMDVGEQRKFVAAAIEQLNGGKRGSGLRVARIAQEQIEVALRETVSDRDPAWWRTVSMTCSP